MRKVSNMSDEALASAMRRFCARGTITDEQVAAAIEEEWAELDARLQVLRGDGRTAPVKAKAPEAQKTAKESATLTAKQKRSRKLQGMYMQIIRKFSARDRKRFAAITKEDGREAAILAMEQELRARERAAKQLASAKKSATKEEQADA